MICLKLSFLYLTVLVNLGTVGHDTGNFPLSDCHTGQFDILILQTIYFSSPTFLAEYVADSWSQGNESHSRVLVSNVVDTWSIDNICNMRFSRFDKIEIDLCNRFHLGNLSSRRPLEKTDQKIKMAAKIFSDMVVGRHNSTRVAVIIQDHNIFTDETSDEIRRLPDLLQEVSSDIKVFLIVHNTGTEVETIFLRDTLVTGDIITKQHISMALCKHCQPGWFQLEYTETRDYLSCYKLHVSPANIIWPQALTTCSQEGQYLATFESTEELGFLRSHLLFHILANRQLIFDSRHSTRESVEVYIGLKRNLITVAKRFQWTLKNPNRNRPLVLNHWLPGNPVGGVSHACGVWVYNSIFSNPISDDPTFESLSTGNSLFTENVSDNVNGWSSVGCGTKLTPLSLCEVTLSRQLKEEVNLRVDPASKVSFSRALSSGDFHEFEGNIVSVSAFLINKAFLDFITEGNTGFPMFYCGDDEFGKTNISYSYVSDFIKHCETGRDEEVHPKQLCSHCQCIPDEAMCDNVIDCVDGSDEENCDTCSGRRCCDGTCLPSHLFNDGEIDCSNCLITDNITVNDESEMQDEYNTSNETCAFICNRNKCIYPSQINDGKLDCTGPEGPLDETIGKLERSKSCFDISGRLIWAPRCVYYSDIYGSVLGCRDLSHLQNCSYFPCQAEYYKCPGSYCIPLHYVKDGKSDCPLGEEERFTVNFTCFGHFRCWKSTVCLHPDLVCDGSAQCQYKEDELNCNVSCIDGLRCIAGTVIVDTNNPLVQLDNIKFLHAQTRYLDLSNVDLSQTEFEEENNVSLYEVKLSGCKILDLYYKFPFGACCMLKVYLLDVSFNRIVSINGELFGYDFGVNLRELNLSNNKHLVEFITVKCEHLENLDLSNTGLSYLDKRSFYGFPKLKYLRLSYTRLSTFHRDILPARLTLKILDLRGSPIVHFYRNTYNSLIITSFLYTDNFRLCCPQVRGDGVPEYACNASEDAISSCFDLIGVGIQQVLLWLMAGITIVGNVIVILYRFFWDRLVLEKAYGLFVLNLGISDSIMGLYLLIVAGADVYYRGVYVLYDMEWKESTLCKIAGFLATLSSETSMLFIFLITVDRFLTLRYPYGQKKFSRITKISVISLSWGIGFIFGIVPVISILGNDKILSSTAMCNGFLMTNQLVNGWEYSLSIFIVLNFVLFVFTALGQVWIFISMSENRMAKESTNQNNLRRVQDIIVAKQLSLVVLCNFLSWFPVGVMGFLSLSGQEISNDIYAWTVVLVLPINSAINPLIYTIPLLVAKWQLLKSRRAKRH